jgi:hypothetical protein
MLQNFNRPRTPLHPRPSTIRARPAAIWRISLSTFTPSAPPLPHAAYAVDLCLFYFSWFPGPKHSPMQPMRWLASHYTSSSSMEILDRACSIIQNGYLHIDLIGGLFFLSTSSTPLATTVPCRALHLILPYKSPKRRSLRGGLRPILHRDSSIPFTSSMLDNPERMLTHRETRSPLPSLHIPHPSCFDCTLSSTSSHPPLQIPKTAQPTRWLAPHSTSRFVDTINIEHAR